jgi:hypothetical protein
MKQWLPAVLALIVGLGLGCWLGYSQRPANISESRQDHTAAVPDKPSANAPLDQQPKTPDITKEKPIETVAPAVKFTFDLPEMPTGEGVTTGRVRLGDGSPCVDLALRAVPYLIPVLSQQKTQQMSVEERVAYEEAVIRQQYEGSREATTAEDGTFKFARLSELYYTALAATPGWKLRLPKGQQPPSFRAGDELDLIATRLVAVPLRVLLPDGSEAAQARVVARALPANISEFTSWTPTRREVEVSPGTVRFYVTGIPDDSMVAEVDAEIPESGSATELAIQLARSPGVYVTLKVPEPYYGDLSVSLLPAEDIVREDSGADPWSSPSRKAARAIGKNQWVFPTVPSGDYVFFVGMQNMLTVLRQRITVTDGVCEFTFELAPLDTSDHFTVRVLDADAKPMSRVRLSCTLGESDVVMGDTTAYLEVGQGEYMMRRPQLRDESRFVPTDGLFICVQAHYGQNKRFGRLPADGDEVEIRFDAGCTLVVEIDNLPEIGRNDMWVAVVPESASIRRESQTARYSNDYNIPGGRNNLMARQEFKDLQAGKVTILVLREADEPATALLRQELTLEPGVQTVKLAMPPLYELIVRTTAAQKIKSMTVVGETLQTSQQTDGQTLRVHSLPAGEYWVGNYTGFMKVTLPAPDGVDFSPSPANCILLYGYDKSGLLYGKGLRRGDLIASINGETVEGHDALRAKWDAATGLDSVRLEIDRKGQILHVTLTGAELAKAIQDGARVNYRRR